MNYVKARMAIVLCGMLSVPAGFANAAGMRIFSASFADGGDIPKVHGADTDDCGGKGISPQVSWSNLPTGTQSVAVLLVDPDGAEGLGVSHWVAYNIAAKRGQLKPGEAQIDGASATLGKNVDDMTAYRGMCPPAGDVPHHYIMTVVATDLAPSTLPPGLTRDALLAALKGHALGGQSIVGRYGR